MSSYGRCPNSLFLSTRFPLYTIIKLTNSRMLYDNKFNQVISLLEPFLSDSLVSLSFRFVSLRFASYHYVSFGFVFGFHAFMFTRFVDCFSLAFGCIRIWVLSFFNSLESWKKKQPWSRWYCRSPLDPSPTWSHIGQMICMICMIYSHYSSYSSWSRSFRADRFLICTM